MFGLMSLFKSSKNKEMFQDTENTESNKNKKKKNGKSKIIMTVNDELPIPIEINKERNIENKNIKSDIIMSEQQINKNDNDDFLSYEDLLTNLKLLSQLKKDQKLLDNSGNLDIDNRNIQALRRFFTSDGRDRTHELLTKIINSSNYHSECLMKSLISQENPDVRHRLQVLTADLSASRTGFRNLIITYREDESFLSKLDLRLDDLSVRIYKNLNFTVN